MNQATELRKPDAETWRRAWLSGKEPPSECHAELVESLAAEFDLRDRRVLEVGAGNGMDSAALEQRGARVHALDFTMEALRITTCSSPAIQPMCGDTLHLPFADGTYDAVFSQGLLEHFSDPLSIVREQSRVVKPGGVLLIDVPQRYSIYTVQKHAKMRQGTWFAEWETEFSLAQLTSLIVAVGLIPARSYGRGYYPAPLLGVRNLHTLDQRRQMPVHLPNAVRKTIERVWQHLEANTWYFRWMMNIGVIGRKPL